MGTDIVSPAKRRSMMQAVRQKQTGIELEVARIVRRLGHRAKANAATLPGRPDLSNQRTKWAIFVHGCFWHGHPDCPKTKGGKSGRIPASNRRFWAVKISGNRRRDAIKARALRARGFRVLTVWECEVRDKARVTRKMVRFFGRCN
ncbi:MAG: very short patch repair endonuclease [Terrimicrobiaceae bacterium]